MNGTDFTENELRYLEFVRRLAETTPRRDVSFLSHPITTRKELLNTLLNIRNQYENEIHLASEMNFTNQKYLESGKRESYYSKHSFPFWKFKTEKEFSDKLLSFVNDYLPQIRIPFTVLEDEDSDVTATFLKHYKTSISLLLKGPPDANKHQIDEALAAQWIAAQKTPERRRLAKLLPGIPTYFIVSNPNKSNYYISLLVYHFWKQAGLSVDGFRVYLDQIAPGNYIDIDEMAYSGTQTTGTLAKMYSILIFKILKQIQEENKTIPSFVQSSNFFPHLLIEAKMAESNINYCIFRVFCSEQGKQELQKIPHAEYAKPLKLPANLIIGEIIKSPKTLFGEKNAARLSILFGVKPGFPAAPVYFDHKVANVPSTYLYPYSYGVVPNRQLLNNEGFWTEKEDERQTYKEAREAIKTNTNTLNLTFLPFLKSCSPGERMMPKNRKELLEYRPPGATGFVLSEPELPQEYRCPYAWYKRINYDTGTYNPLPLPIVPLPYGPTEENFVGGKRLTRKRALKRRGTSIKRMR